MPSNSVLSPQHAKAWSIRAMSADPEFRRRVGARIRAAREAQGLSQSALARLLPGSVDPNYVSRWERGENLPSWKNLHALATALGVTVAHLINDGPMPPGI